jgi:pilus assembly protein CpaB
LKRSNRILLVVGVALAVVSFVVVLALGNFGQQAQTPASVDVPVVVATTDIALGTQVTADMVSTSTKPQAESTGTYQNPDDVVGKVVRQPIVSGAVLTTDDFSTATVQDVTGSLPAGMRAIAIPLDKVDSVGALLQPGDRVDVLLSMEDLDGLNPVVVPSPSQAPTTSGTTVDPYTLLDAYLNNTTVKVVVQNVQVVAAMAKLTDDGSGDNASGQASTDPDMVVLLAVTPQQAEVVRFAQLDGNVSLVLRSPADKDAAAVDTSGITLKQLVDQYGVLPPAPVQPVTP